MLVKNIYNIAEAWKVTGKKFLIVFLYTFTASYIDDYYNVHFADLSKLTLGMIATGVTIFLGFRINSAYNRWWEARQIWGAMVNNCRNFGSTVSVFTEATMKEHTRDIVFNLIGFINATRLHLRRQTETEWQNELWNYQTNGRNLFSPEEVATIKNKTNKPTQILHLISHKLDSLASHSTAPNAAFFKVYLNQLLLPLYDCLGKSERIKNTPFPWGYAFYTVRFVWIFTLLLPLTFNTDASLANILGCTLASMLFITAEQVAHNLDSPFENSFNDTPLTAICRTIEIDLLEQLNEKEIPKTIEPKDGVLP